MKVLHLSSEKHWRGGEQQIAYLVQELQKGGIENVVAARALSPFARFCREKGIKGYDLPFRNSIDIRTAFAIKTICEKEAVDIVHLHSAKSHTLGVLSCVLGNRTPLVLSRRVVFPPSNGWFTRWKYNHPAIKRVLCVSNKVASIMKAYLADPGKVLTVYSGVDLGRYRSNSGVNKLREELAIPAEKVLIGNTSALEAEKDYDTFVRTIDILVKRGLQVHAVIIGDGSKAQELGQVVRDRGLDGDITFTGFRKDLVDILPCLDFFLMTSTLEGLGTSVLDAFSSGLVVVSTDAGGLPEMVVHESSGLLAPVGSADRLADQIERVMRDPHLRARLKEGGRRAVERFSKENMARETLAVYQTVLGK